MAIALVQNPYVNGPGSLTTWNISLTQATGSGNLLAVVLTYYPVSANTVTSMTDNATGGSNTYTQVPGAFGLTGTPPAGTTDIWYCPNCKSGATTLTITFSATVTFQQGGLLEYSGVALSSPIDVAGVVTQQTGATTSGPNLTITNAGDVLVAVCNVGNTVTGVNAPWVSEGNPNNQSAVAQYLPGATGTYSPTFTGVSGGYCVSAAAFFPASTGNFTTRRSLTRVGM
jgi:hypothetical protein